MSALPAAWQPATLAATPIADVRIGASQISAILGIDRFTTAEQLYRRFLGLEPWEPENKDMKRGKFMEPALCAWWLDLSNAERKETDFERCGVILQNRQLEVRHSALSWVKATPDMVALRDGQLLAVDVKSPRAEGKKVGGEWVKTWHQASGTAPAGYVAQSIFQQGVLRSAGVPVVAGELAAGPLWGELIRVAVPFDAEFFADMLALATEFYAAVVGRKPLPSHFTTKEETK